MMRVLVTGGGGFLGRYIVERLLARGDEVRCFGRGAYPELVEIGVDVVRGNLTQREEVHDACDAVDAVIHSAAIAGIWGAWKSFQATNIRGTEHVVSACRDHQIDALVYTSSPSVTFDGTDQKNIDESAPYPQRWLCHYPRSKAEGERIVLAANSDRLRTCALRPHLIWGPRDTHLVPRLIERARQGQLRRVGSGTNWVDMTYVENAASAHLAALDALKIPPFRPAGKAYFISQGEPVNCWDWINELLQLADLAPVTRSISRKSAERLGGVLEAIWTCARWKSEPRMTRFLAAQLATDHYFDIGAAQRDFGYKPEISTMEGMRRLRNSMR